MIAERRLKSSSSSSSSSSAPRRSAGAPYGAAVRGESRRPACSSCRLEPHVVSERDWGRRGDGRGDVGRPPGLRAAGGVSPLQPPRSGAVPSREPLSGRRGARGRCARLPALLIDKKYAASRCERPRRVLTAGGVQPHRERAGRARGWGGTAGRRRASRGTWELQLCRSEADIWPGMPAPLLGCVRAGD